MVVVVVCLVSMMNHHGDGAEPERPGRRRRERRHEGEGLSFWSERILTPVHPLTKAGQACYRHNRCHKIG